MTSFSIIPADEHYIESFRRCLDIVARERQYLAITEAPPREAARAFVQTLISGAGIQYYALDDDEQVIGWCDVVKNPLEGFRHCGQLGMGLAPFARGRGIGRALADATIERAWDMGLERIELEVFASNVRAKALYDALGFVVEGVKVHSRKLDGRYDDNILMVLKRKPGT